MQGRPGREARGLVTPADTARLCVLSTGPVANARTSSSGEGATAAGVRVLSRYRLAWCRFLRVTVGGGPTGLFGWLMRSTCDGLRQGVCGAVFRSGQTSMVQILYLPHRGQKRPLADGDAGQGPSYVISLRQSLSDDGM